MKVQQSLLCVSRLFHLLRCLWSISALPQLDLSLSQAQFPQAGQLLVPILQSLELGQAPHSGCLVPKRPIECSRGKALLLGYTSETQYIAALSEDAFNMTLSQIHDLNAVSNVLQ